MTKIMLVEDDNNLREIYEARLSAEGYEIVSAADGEEALAIAVREKPDLIISDVMMPKISGFDMLDILRSTPETKNAKVIMMTALSQAEDKERADKLGADRYLVKSQVTLEDVVGVAREVLGEKAIAVAPADSQDSGPASSPPEPPASPPVAAPIIPATPTPIPITVKDDSNTEPTTTASPPLEPAVTPDASALQAAATSSATTSDDEEAAITSQIASFVSAKDAAEPANTPDPTAAAPEPSTADAKLPANNEPAIANPEPTDDSPVATQTPGQTITPSV